MVVVSTHDQIIIINHDHGQRTDTGAPAVPCWRPPDPMARTHDDDVFSVIPGAVVAPHQSPPVCKTGTAIVVRLPCSFGEGFA